MSNGCITAYLEVPFAPGAFRPYPRQTGSDRQKRCPGTHHWRFPTRQRLWPIRSPGFPLSDAPELGHSFLSLPYFLWAHRSGNSSPLRPTRLLLYRFRPQQHWVPSNKADASLRLQAPSLSLVPQRKQGRKKGKNKMSYLNSVTLVGFVGADPEQRQAKANGSKFTVLSVATQRSWKNTDDEWASKTEWHRVCVFRPRLAEYVATTIKKGSHVLVEGSLRSEEHTSELQSRLHLVCRLLLEKKKPTAARRRQQFPVLRRPGSTASRPEPHHSRL